MKSSYILIDSDEDSGDLSNVLIHKRKPFIDLVKSDGIYGTSELKSDEILSEKRRRRTVSYESESESESEDYTKTSKSNKVEKMKEYLNNVEISSESETEDNIKTSKSEPEDNIKNSKSSKSSKSQEYKFKIMKNSTRKFIINNAETDFIEKFGVSLDKNWGGDWETKTIDHSNFEKKTHDDGIYFLQQTNTDPFFRTLQKLLKNNYMFPSDIRSKIGLTQNIKQYKEDSEKAVNLLQEFMKKNGDNLKLFSNYKLSEKNTFLFAILVKTAKAIEYLSESKFDEAFNVWHNYASYLLSEWDNIVNGNDDFT